MNFTVNLALLCAERADSVKGEMTMGNAAYEQRRNEQAERQLAEERKAIVRKAREEAADALLDVMLPALKDLFDGNACLLVEDGPLEGSKIVRFRRG